MTRPITTVLALLSLCCSVLAESSDAETVLVCSRLNAKQMPGELEVPAIVFTGPAGDGRRGSAGFVVRSQDIAKAGKNVKPSEFTGGGTRWDFVFQRAKSGFHFQVIHPFQRGHVIVSLAQGVTVHRGGSWGKIGWGNPAGSDKVVLTPAGQEITASWLPADVPHRIASQLTETGEYQLSIDGAVICKHQIKSAKTLILESGDERIWGGSSWDRTSFEGRDLRPARVKSRNRPVSGFNRTLEAGDAGLILAPMDGSGPSQNFQQVKLTRLQSRKTSDEHFAPLFERIADAREFNKSKRSRATGGGGGGAFEATPDQVGVLVGFDYSTSTFYGGHLIIKSLRPVYRTPQGEQLGKWHGVPHGKTRRLHANEGYVIAGVVTKSGHRVDGIRVIYMKVKHGRLNPDDTYRSKWIGGKGGGAETQLAGDGDAIIGLYGRKGTDLDSLGFIQLLPY